MALELTRSPLADNASRALLRHGWLRRQSRAFASALLSEASVRRVDAGAAVLAAGDHAPGLLGVVEGSIAVRLTSHGRAPYLCDIRAVGSWCGRSPILTLTPAAVTVEARTETTLVQVPSLALARLVRLDGETAQALGDLAREHIERLTGLVDVAYARDPVAKVSAKLLSMVADDERDALAMTQSELAEMSNLSRHRVNRVLTELEAHGAIVVGYRRVAVRDKEALRRGAGLADLP